MAPGNSPTTTRESILIVEDNSANAHLFRSLLEKADFDVQMAANADETYVVLSEFAPKLILIDVQLSGIDGMELARRLKGDPQYKDIAIVALTGNDENVEVQRILGAGCAGYIGSSVDTSTFANSIRQYLGGETGKVVLIAENDPAQRRLLEIHFAQSGFQVTTAKDGAEALECMNACQPDVVLSEVLLPRVDGFRLAQFIRSEPALASVPVVLMTFGGIRLDDKLMAQSMGANAILSRTEGFDQIVAGVRAALAQGVAAAAVQDPQPIADLRKRPIEEAVGDSRGLLNSLQSGFDLLSSRQLAHRWASMGGTFGLPQVSQTAFEIQRLLEEVELDSQALRARLAELNDLFSAAARMAEPGPVSEAVAASLSGQRFAVVGFDELEAIRLTETMGQANAFLRMAPALSDIGEDKEHPFDAVILSVSDDPRDAAQTNFLAKLGKPLVAVGSSSATLEAVLNAHRGEHDFVVRPWTPSELVLRCHAVTSRSAELAARNPVRSPNVKARILIGDDDSTSVALVKMTLGNYHMDCGNASSGGKVLEASMKSKPDVIILDVNMPQMDGFEVLSALKANENTKNIPVVLLTARQQETDILRGFSLGAEDYVTKPFSPMELVARIKRILHRPA